MRHFSSATRRTFQPPFTPIYYKKLLSAIAAVKLRAETKTLLDKKPEVVKADVRTLKRMILEDIFPDDLAKMPGSQAAKENSQKPAGADDTRDVQF